MTIGKGVLISKSRGRTPLSQRKNRRLQIEQLESRKLLAADITGRIYQDFSDNGLDAGDTRLGGVNVVLFRDGGNTTYDSGTGTAAAGDDVLVGTATSAVTTGLYSFSVNAVGTYFVVQSSVAAGLIQRSVQRVQTVIVTSSDIAGVGLTTIDTFDTTAQTVNASVGGTNPDFDATLATEAIGGERDLFVNATSGALSINADTPSTANLLSFAAGAGANGTRVLSYDSVDNDAQVLATSGLGGVDLTSAGAATGFRFQIGADTDMQITIQVHSGANASTRTVAIPMTSATLNIPFADFTAINGTGADFANVGAIQITLSGPDAADAIIDSIQTIGATVLTVDFANLTPMTIGNQVFLDNDRNGRNEPQLPLGISGVTLQLFTDTNNNGVFDAGVDIATLNSSNVPISTTSDSVGVYALTNLFPGQYFVVIPSSQFLAAGPAAGLVVTETTPAGTNNTNKGLAVAGTGVVTSIVSLNAGAAPTNDGDTDNNTDLSFDIGLARPRDRVDLRITGSGPSVATVGSTITYSLTAFNDGPAGASATVVNNILPDGTRAISATFNGRAQFLSTLDPQVIRFNIFSLNAGERNSSFVVVAEVLPSAPTVLINRAVIFSFPSFPPLDTNTSNNQVSISTTVSQLDLAVTKSAPSFVNAGNTLTYTINVTNNSAQEATRVQVQDSLPAGVTFVSGTVFKGNNSIGTVIGAANNLATTEISSVFPGDLVVVTIVVLVSQSSSGTLVNTVVIDSVGDTNPTNNTASATTQILGSSQNNSISGYVYADVDNDGQRFVTVGGSRIAQTGIPNVLVQLTKASTGEVFQSFTGSDGFYEFKALADDTGASRFLVS